MTSFFTEAQRQALLRDYFAAQEAVDHLIASAGELDPVRAEKFRQLSLRIGELKELYRSSLPILPLSRCPFTGELARHSFDPFGLDGLWWNYSDAVRPGEQLPRTFVVLTGALKLGRQLERMPFLCRPGPSAPFVLPHLLRSEATRAVLSYHRVGQHHGFAICYFSALDRDGHAIVNSWAMDHDEMQEAGGGTQLSANDVDFDLAPWILSGKLLWIAPDDAQLRLQDSLGSCPYLGLANEARFCKIYDGRVWVESMPEPTVAAPVQHPSVVCPSCGAPSQPEKKFCGDCGSSLAQPAPVEPTSSATTPLPEKPEMSVRGWLRSFGSSKPGDLMLNFEEVRALALALRRARDDKHHPADKLRQVQEFLRLRGPEGSVWTIGLGSLQWSRYANGKWEPAEPPQYVSLDASMMARLNADGKGATTRASSLPPMAVATQADAPRSLCPTCGTPQRPGARFCPVDGTKIAARQI